MYIHIYQSEVDEIVNRLDGDKLAGHYSVRSTVEAVLRELGIEVREDEVTTSEEDEGRVVDAGEKLVAEEGEAG